MKPLRHTVLLIGLLLASSADATNISTADPSYPASFADIDSEPLRQQFDDTINDIDNLWLAIGPNFLEANQILGALVSGKATAIPMPSCFSSTNAITWQPGYGFGCNNIAGGGGTLGPAPAFTVIAGPSGGSPAIPTAIALTANYLPLPSSNSIGGVQSVSPVAHQFMVGINTSGVPLLATPVFSDVSGTLGASQLPTPSTSSLGGTESIAVIPHNYMTGISLSGVPTQAQPSFGDISGNVSVSQMASGSGASATTFWRGDGTWAVITPTGGTVPISSGGTGATSAHAALDNLFGNTTTGQISQNEARLYNGGASSYIAQNHYCFNCDPILLRHHRTALAQVRSGQANKRILVLSDSTGFGTGSNNSNTGNLKPLSWPTQLSGFLNSAGINSHWNSILTDGSAAFETNHANDFRVTMGSSWAQAAGTNGESVGGQMYENTGSATNALSFLPTVNVDTFVVWYKAFPGGGTFSLDINGSGTATHSTNGSNGMASTTISGSLGSDTLNIKWSSGGTVDVGFIEAYDSSKKWIDVMNAGWSGSHACDLAINTNAWSPLNAIASINAALVFLDIGINDWAFANTPLATYKGCVQTIITQVLANGSDIVLVTPAPSDPADQNASIATQGTFIDTMYALAVSNNIPLIDNYTRFGPAASNGAMYWTGNGVHPNMIGNADFGEPVEDLIVRSYTQ